jgi:hypothetical protein
MINVQTRQKERGRLREQAALFVGMLPPATTLLKNLNE